VLLKLARKHNAQPKQATLAWFLARSPRMLPIPGTSLLVHLLVHLEENPGAAVKLIQEEMAELGSH
jgi:pyridoxine 4-dehydrogenase